MENAFNNPTESITNKVEAIWAATCGSWQSSNIGNLESFLKECTSNGIDPQFCMSWLEQHGDSIQSWNSIRYTVQECVNRLTSTGSPFPEEGSNS
ncbi:hypothetical protein [Peribacillus sp. SCS-155]|uniref:hypothetical protein n=1 Tax=Peribacillus sedimenti TaxID=3115297 RepID=UPI0039061E1B